MADKVQELADEVDLTGLSLELELDCKASGFSRDELDNACPVI
jgi:hypothetical protein